MESNDKVPPPYAYIEPMETKNKPKKSLKTRKYILNDASNMGKLQTLKLMAKGYAEATGIHGIAYLGEEGRSPVEK